MDRTSAVVPGPRGGFALAGALVLAVVFGASPSSRLVAAAEKKPTALEKEARTFLATVSPLLQPVATVSAEAAWLSSTDVSPEHTGLRTGADQAFAALSGSPVIIEKARGFLAKEKELSPLTARQLKRLLLAAAEAPGTIPAVVKERVAAEAAQAAIQDGFSFCLTPSAKAANGCARPTTANEIDDLLVKSRDVNERTKVWSASKEIGSRLKPGLVKLRKLRNQVAKELGYSSFFALQVADYDMSVGEMMALLDQTLETTKPLYDQLHCYARHTLAARYNKPVPPKNLPAPWLTNRWGQRWVGLVEGQSLDGYFKGSSPETIVKSAESFYTSIGFPALPASFWQASDLYPVPAGQPRKKNSHASAWHLDHDKDVRSLMSVEPNAQWFGTAHHELGHIYYFLSYARPEVPVLLREGANRAFHEAIGELARLASEETPYLKRVGVLPASASPNATDWLLQSALDSVVFLPFSAGVMSHFERDLYEEELPPETWQRRWWDYVALYQGIEPPAPRTDELCDACTKTHINDDPAQYYDYALATLTKFQLHDHICTKLLHQDVHACDYGGHKEVGDFLRGILALGATRDWRQVLEQATGEPLSSRALMSFYAPLTDELAKRNAGKSCAR